ncbi:MAG: BamA/TamA family outer membrane protein [Rubricoccaceae bacterium]
MDAAAGGWPARARAGIVCALVLAAATSVTATSAAAQPATGWTVVARTDTLAGTPADTLAVVRASDAEGAARRALATLRQRGYAFARVDSAGPGPTLFATAGPRVVVAGIEAVGVFALPEAALREGWQTRPGAPLDSAALAADLALALARYAEAGLPRARITPEVTLLPTPAGPTAGPTAGARLTLRVDEGARPVLSRLELRAGGRRSRTDAVFAARAAGLPTGVPLGALDRAALRRELDATGLFASVGEPELAADPADPAAVVLVVPVEDAPPGAFDLVLGYLPPALGAPGQLVGAGELALRNLSGAGRVARVALVRSPGLVSSLDLEAAVPFVFGTPLRVGGAFAGLAQDSLYARQRYRAEASLRVASGLEVEAVVSREAVQPGRAGAALVDGTPRVARAEALWAGLGLRARRVDASRRPRRGFAADVLVERGQRVRSTGPGEATARAARERLAASVRAYVPAPATHALALGLDARVVLGARPAEGRSRYDEAELFRIGGAASLRGYDEEAFLGQAVGRALAEYRVPLDARSLAFAFADLGFVSRPDLPSLPRARAWLPGYGLGVLLGTPAGLVSATYALNPDLPLARGKLHLGVSLGL